MTTLINVARVVALCGFVVFMATYHMLAPWWRSEMGRNIMTLSAGCTALLAMGLLPVLFGPDYFGRDALRFAGIGLCGAAVWWRWVIMMRIQIGDRSGTVGAATTGQGSGPGEGNHSGHVA